MHLIDVDAVLNIEKESETSAETNVLHYFDDDDDDDDRLLMDLRYAILSHRWQGEEIAFRDMKKLTKGKLQNRSGEKVVGTCKVAQDENIKWVWVDSCCIGVDVDVKRDAINSMYRWYRCSQTCYAYLHDVAKDNFPRQALNKSADSEWFFRGWTLQELIAPQVLKFFDQSWNFIGDRSGLAPTLNRITRIPEDLLVQTNGPGVPRTLTETFGVARIMSWAADRGTKRPEDRAYSLVGLFGVELKVDTGLYGIGGRKAFQSLQEALISEYGDQSIFSWSGQPKGNILAESPSDFRDCFDVVPWRPSSWSKSLLRPPFQIGQGSITTRLRLTRCRGSSYIFQAELACCHNKDGSKDQKSIVITLAEVNDVYYRISGDFRSSDEAEEREIVLRCRPIDSSFKFNVNGLLKTIRLGADRWNRKYVHQVRDQIDIQNGQHEAIRYDHVVSSVCHPHYDKRFSIVLGFFGGRISVHVAHDGPSDKVTPDVVHHANCMDRLREEISTDPASRFELVMHYHIPRTIQALKLAYKSESWRGGFVTLDIVKCFGCCMPGWMSVDMVSQHDEKDEKVAKCFGKIKQSYSIVSPLEIM